MSHRENEIRRYLRDAGYELIRKGRHQVWINAEGHRLVTSGSPSDGNAIRQIKREVARAKREKKSA